MMPLSHPGNGATRSVFTVLSTFGLLATRGFIVVVADYRIYPEVKFPRVPVRLRGFRALDA